MSAILVAILAALEWALLETMALLAELAVRMLGSRRRMIHLTALVEYCYTSKLMIYIVTYVMKILYMQTSRVNDPFTNIVFPLPQPPLFSHCTPHQVISRSSTRVRWPVAVPSWSAPDRTTGRSWCGTTGRSRPSTLSRTRTK